MFVFVRKNIECNHIVMKNSSVDGFHQMDNVKLQNFCNLYNLKNLIKVSTCFKNATNPTCIDIMLTNTYRSFQNFCVIETGFSAIHKMAVTIMKTHF